MLFTWIEFPIFIEKKILITKPIKMSYLRKSSENSSVQNSLTHNIIFVYISIMGFLLGRLGVVKNFKITVHYEKLFDVSTDKSPHTHFVCCLKW